MKRVASGFLPVIAVDRRASEPLHRQIYNAIRSAIQKRNLSPGEKIPSSRELALDLKVSRIPVLNAYAQLLAEGFIESRKGVGTFVSNELPGEDLNRIDFTSRGICGKHSGRPVSSNPMPPPFVARPWMFGHGAFSIGQVALEHFPFPTWSRLMARHFRQVQAKFLNFSDPMGSLEFRRTLANYLRTSRAVNCEAEQILIVSGSQQALEITARVLFDSRSRVWVEEPSYKLARNALLATGCEIVPVPVDAEGLDVSAGIRLARKARGAIVTPSHQFPLGAVMTASRRLQLLDWAEQAGAWIIEDDYDSEYRYGAMPISSLQGLDRNQRVVYIGTFSKTLFPAIRIGYIVVPPDLVDPFLALRHSADLFPPLLYQDVLRRFIEDGHYSRHIRRTRQIYEERRNVLVHSLRSEFDSSLPIIGSEAGLHLVVTLPRHISDQEIALRAAESKLWLYPLSSNFSGKRRVQGFVLGYGSAGVPEIRAGVRRLHQLLRKAKPLQR